MLSSGLLLSFELPLSVFSTHGTNQIESSYLVRYLPADELPHELMLTSGALRLLVLQQVCMVVADFICMVLYLLPCIIPWRIPFVWASLKNVNNTFHQSSWLALKTTLFQLPLELIVLLVGVFCPWRWIATLRALCAYPETRTSDLFRLLLRCFAEFLILFVFCFLMLTLWRAPATLSCLYAIYHGQEVAVPSFIIALGAQYPTELNTFPTISSARLKRRQCGFVIIMQLAVLILDLAQCLEVVFILLSLIRVIPFAQRVFPVVVHATIQCFSRVKTIAHQLNPNEGTHSRQFDVLGNQRRCVFFLQIV
jgi:hypothetical protein